MKATGRRAMVKRLMAGLGALRRFLRVQQGWVKMRRLGLCEKSEDGLGKQG
jgi:hypothetical protein